MPEQFSAFVDYTTMPPGTPLAASALNTLILLQSCLLSGGIPTTSSTLTITQPATLAIVNTGAAIAAVSPTSTPLTVSASQDSYVDLSTSGTYTVSGVANGATAPAVAPASVRLYKAVSGSSSVTSIVPLLPNSGTARSGPTPVNPFAVSAPDETTAHILAYGTQPAAPTDTLQQTIWRLLYRAYYGITSVAQTAIAYDSTEAASAGGSASLLDNMNHLRDAIATLAATSFTSAETLTPAALRSNGANMAATFTAPHTLQMGGIAVPVSSYEQGTALVGNPNGGQLGSSIPVWTEVPPAITTWYHATTAYAGGSFIAGQKAFVTITVPGARLGDVVLASYAPTSVAANRPYTLSAHVSTGNTLVVGWYYWTTFTDPGGTVSVDWLATQVR